MEIFFILGTHLFLAIVLLGFKDSRAAARLNILGALAAAVFSAALCVKLGAANQPISLYNFFYADMLSAVFIMLISLISLAAAVYSAPYIAAAIKAGQLNEKKSCLYYLLFNLFILSMFFVTMVNNLGIVWVAVEMTTLISAFLVGFYTGKASVEAAWKYIIICSVGITLALLGTILFYYAAAAAGGGKSLNWTDMAAVAGKMDLPLVKIAFLFILVGYGTKAGLAPMHTWLPDAHSQALTPISALLSGVLLKTTIYAILRFTVIVNKCGGSQYCANLFIFFGLLSMGIAAGFVLVQKDLKRLLAYSSIDHIGIIFVGLGAGGPLGIYAALLHSFNHAFTKTLMFFGAGNVIKKYNTNNMNMIRGAGGVLPFSGFFLILGAFALAGSPPFSIFISEILILLAAFSAGRYLVAGLYLGFTVIIFGAIIYHFSRIVFGRAPQQPRVREPLGVKLVFMFLFALICLLGLVIPPFLHNLFSAAADLLKGA